MRAAEDAIVYGPRNVGAGVVACADAPNTLQANLTLQTWIIRGGCAPGDPDDGPDGRPCTSDDPGLQKATAAQADFACSGDCNGDGEVTIDEVLQAVGFALDGTPPYSCPSLIRSGFPLVAVDAILKAVGNALEGCTLLHLQ